MTRPVMTTSSDEMTSDQVAERLGVQSQTVRAWRLRGAGPRFMKVGRRVVYRSADVEAFEVERMATGPAEA